METDETQTPAPSGGVGTGRRLTKSPHDRVIAGVAGGLAECFGVDAVLFRIGFVALSIAGGSGLALYGLGWLLLPEVDDHETVDIDNIIHPKPPYHGEMPVRHGLKPIKRYDRCFNNRCQT